MGKQYKVLSNSDMAFIKKQKLFYLASASKGEEVNLSPKGYDSIRVLNNSSLLFINYPGSGNRTFRDAANDGEFTLVFNAFEGDAKILRLFCKADTIDPTHADFNSSAELFKLNPVHVRDFFKFNIYAIESSCGMSVPVMEYKEERKQLKNWVVKMQKNDKLQEYKDNHLIPPNIKDL